MSFEKYVVSSCSNDKLCHIINKSSRQLITNTCSFPFSKKYSIWRSNCAVIYSDLNLDLLGWFGDIYGVTHFHNANKQNLTLKNLTVLYIISVLTFVLLIFTTTAAKVLEAYPCVICLLGIANKILWLYHINVLMQWCIYSQTALVIFLFHICKGKKQNTLSLCVLF